jgi:3-deoxy-D-manno-octulosonate 8-phosphate phosphatase (KDO 8-P phosphatase)
MRETAFVGNDINDLACLEAVGLPIVVADAHEDVIPHAMYRTKTPGGHGAVREVCDLIEAVQRS